MNSEATRLWIMPLTVWAALTALLGITVAVSYVPLGLGNGIISMSIAAIKAALIVLFFMKLKSSSALLRLAAAAGLFWLLLMFLLAWGDYLTR